MRWRRRKTQIVAVEPQRTQTFPVRRFVVLWWFRPEAGSYAADVEIFVGDDTIGVRATDGSGSPVYGAYAVARVAQLDTAGDEVQMLFFNPDRTLEMLWIRCADDWQPVQITSAVINRWEHLMRRSFPVGWILTNSPGHFGPP